MADTLAAAHHRQLSQDQDFPLFRQDSVQAALCDATGRLVLATPGFGARWPGGGERWCRWWQPEGAALLMLEVAVSAR